LREDSIISASSKVGIITESISPRKKFLYIQYSPGNSETRLRKANKTSGGCLRKICLAGESIKMAACMLPLCLPLERSVLTVASPSANRSNAVFPNRAEKKSNASNFVSGDNTGMRGSALFSFAFYKLPHLNFMAHNPFDRWTAYVWQKTVDE